MRRKIISIILTMLMIITAFPAANLTARAEDEDEKDGYHRIYYDGNESTHGVVPTDHTLYPSYFETTVKDKGSMQRTGHIFLGWMMEDDEEENLYFPGDPIYVFDEDIFLYAVWLPCFKVVYDANNATSGKAPVDNNTYTEDDGIIVLGDNGIKRTGFVFKGWTLERNDPDEIYEKGDEIDGEDVYAEDGIVKLYAYWSKLYSVTYNANGAKSGKVPVDKNTYENDEDAIVSGNPNKLAKPGYIFAGWTLKPNKGVVYKKGDDITIEGKNITLYAKWERVVHASKPTITKQPMLNSTVNKNKLLKLSIKATKKDAGNLTYQWYSNTKKSDTGGKKISGEKKNTYKVPTKRKGTMYYYCVITNKNNKATGNKTATAKTKLAKVVVK